MTESAASVQGSPSSPKAVRSDRVRNATSRLLRAPALWLTGVVSVSALARAWISLGVPSPWVLPDELLYSDLARSIGDGGMPAVRGFQSLGWGVIYPALIAPSWRMFHDPYVAYHAALVVNALMMSLAAIPAYALARLFVSRGSSLWVAVLAILVPSLSYTGAALTENAFYPLFLVALLVVARAVRRPTLGAQLLALGVLGLLAMTRIQAVALLGAYAGGVMIYAWTTSARRSAYPRRFLPSMLVIVPAALAPVVVSTARGAGPLGWLGGRSSTFEGFHASEVPQWVAALAADLVLYVAVVPVLATAIVVPLGLSRRAADEVRLFAALAVPTLGAILLSIAIVSASFDVDGVGNLNERYVFHVVPLLFIGLALWIEQGRQRPRPWAVAAVGVACLATALLPVERLDYNAGLQALALLPLSLLSLTPAGTSLLVAAVTIACGAFWLTCGERTAGRLWILIAVWMVVLTLFTVESNRVSASKTAAAFDGEAATWVDNALPAGANVAVLWDENRGRRGLPDSFYFWLMVTEFFNRSVGNVYRLGPPTLYENVLPTRGVSVGPGRSILGADRRPIRAEFALVTCRTPIDGHVVASAPRGALQLVRVAGPIRLTNGPGCSREQP